VKKLINFFCALLIAPAYPAMAASPEASAIILGQTFTCDTLDIENLADKADLYLRGGRTKSPPTPPWTLSDVAAGHDLLVSCGGVLLSRDQEGISARDRIHLTTDEEYRFYRALARLLLPLGPRENTWTGSLVRIGKNIDVMGRYDQRTDVTEHISATCEETKEEILYVKIINDGLIADHKASLFGESLATYSKTDLQRIRKKATECRQILRELSQDPNLWAVENQKIEGLIKNYDENLARLSDLARVADQASKEQAAAEIKKERTLACMSGSDYKRWAASNRILELSIAAALVDSHYATTPSQFGESKAVQDIGSTEIMREFLAYKAAGGSAHSWQEIDVSEAKRVDPCLKTEGK
jgi:hypothetical protein